MWKMFRRLNTISVNFFASHVGFGQLFILKGRALRAPVQRPRLLRVN
jgi:hypothetical protein